jgi:hypothetical protein
LMPASAAHSTAAATWSSLAGYATATATVVFSLFQTCTAHPCSWSDSKTRSTNSRDGLQAQGTAKNRGRTQEFKQACFACWAAIAPPTLVACA